MNQRRSFLKSSVALASALSMPALARAAVAAPHERSLRFYNTHTGETLRTMFWAEGEFIPDALQDINRLLRDHRSNTVAPIDPELIVLLNKVSTQFGSNNVIHVISGYRSPETNRKLAEASGGVAKHSMHLEGKAIDVRIPGYDLNDLRKAALAQKRGGVGYYPDSKFVHMDTGRVRHW
ncbi:YcbK family protein [Pseudoduganella rhizocola]|uniref:YcbK family protein n=1 Tax=Pseudoduganella rhizocola TaxID=3382643 RepID=UPI0038B624B6